MRWTEVQMPQPSSSLLSVTEIAGAGDTGEWRRRGTAITHRGALPVMNCTVSGTRYQVRGARALPQSWRPATDRCIGAEVKDWPFIIVRALKGWAAAFGARSTTLTIYTSAEVIPFFTSLACFLLLDATPTWSSHYPEYSAARWLSATSNTKVRSPRRKLCTNVVFLFVGSVGWCGAMR